MWDDLFEKSTYWRYVIWYDFNNFCVLETIVLRMIAGLKKKKKKDKIKKNKCKPITRFSYTEGEGYYILP